MTLPDLVANDTKLVAHVRNQGPGSREARALEARLAEYGLGTLINMFQSGHLPRAISRITGRNFTTPSQDNIYYLAYGAVSEALPRFMWTFVFGGRWDPSRGAALGTVFVNACLFSLDAESRRLERLENRRTEFPVGDLELLGELDQIRSASVNTTDPEAALLDREGRNELLAPLDSRARMVVQNLAEGRTSREIADELGITADGVRKILARARVKITEELERQSVDQGSSRQAESDILRQAQARLSLWGIRSVEDVMKVRAAIERQRALYEDPSKTALNRPVPGLAKNQLDIVLDGIPVEPPVDRTRWVANNARVCRALLASVQEVLPSVQRPNDRVKGLVRDVQELYRDLKIVSMVARPL